MKVHTSEHILNSSADLLGFCLFVITAVQLSSKRELTVIDEVTAVNSMFFSIPAILSFLSMRSSKEVLANRLEQVAEYIFMLGLLGVAAVIVVIVLDIVQ